MQMTYMIAMAAVAQNRSVVDCGNSLASAPRR